MPDKSSGGYVPWKAPRAPQVLEPGPRGCKKSGGDFRGPPRDMPVLLSVNCLWSPRDTGSRTGATQLQTGNKIQSSRGNSRRKGGSLDSGGESR